MTYRNKTRILVVLSIVVLLVMALAACSSDPEPTDVVQNEPEQEAEHIQPQEQEAEQETEQEPAPELLETVEPEPEVYEEENFERNDIILQLTFDDATWAEHGARVNYGGQVSGERVTDFGQDDDSSFRLTNVTGNYASGQGNFITLHLEEPLGFGGTYRLSWYIYIPSDRNPDKDEIPGSGLVLDSTFGSSVHQPTNAFDLDSVTPMDQWVNTTVDFTVSAATNIVNHFTFRFRINDEPNVPTVWYIDNIELTLIHYIPHIEPEWDVTLPSIREAWEDYFIVGNIMEPALISANPRYVREMFLHHYGAVTAENAMKPDAISGGQVRYRPNNLNLANAEMVVRFAEENDLFMVGHTLVWHSQSAPWFNQHPETGDPITRAEAVENMRWFIENYAGHFEGRVDAWDVTNEVFTGGGSANMVTQSPEGATVYPVGSWQRAMRNYVPWYRAFANGADFEAGESATDYVYYAFKFARRYAPSALLIYNDYNEWFFRKRDAIANMTIELNERWHNDSVNNPAYGNPDHPDYGRLLIEVIGMQAHVNENTNFQDVYRALQRFSETGARIHITELDLTFANITDVPMLMTPDQEQRQADLYAQLFKWYRQFSDYIDRVTFWGREDSSSWRAARSPLIFDRFYRPKKSFWAVIDPEGWLGVE